MRAANCAQFFADYGLPGDGTWQSIANNSTVTGTSQGNLDLRNESANAWTVGFVLARYLYQHLGDTRYGWWLIIAALTSYFGFFDLGLRGSVGRNIAFHRARGEQDRVNAIVSTAVLILGAVAGLVLLATLALPALFFHWYAVPAAEQAGVRLALLLVGANLALTRAELIDLGVENAREVSAVAATIRAATCADASLVVLDDPAVVLGRDRLDDGSEDPESAVFGGNTLVDGIGAVLRFPIGPT